MPYRTITGVGHDGRVVIDDPDPSLLGAHTVLTTGAHGIGGQWFQTYLQRGVSRAGITAGQAGYFFEEFTDISRWQKNAGAASMLGQTTLPGGVGEIAAVAVDSVLYFSGSAALGSPSLAPGAGQWYMAGRIRLPIAPPAAGYALCGLRSAAPDSVYFGYSGPDDLTHFVAVSDVGAGVIDVAYSTVTIGAIWHDFELWSTGGGAYRLAVDNEAPVSLTVAIPAASFLYPFFQAMSGLNPGDNTTLQLDKLLYVFPQAA